MTPETADDVDDAVLYEQLAPELVRFAAALVGRVDAPDVLSQAVVKALATPAWPTVANRRAYLYRAVVNEATTWRSRAERRPVLEARAAGTGVWARRLTSCDEFAGPAASERQRSSS